jgi:hypothetical protein
MKQKNKNFEYYSNSKKILILLTIILTFVLILIYFIEAAALLILKKVDEQPSTEHETYIDYVYKNNPLAFKGSDDYDEIKRDWIGPSYKCPANRVIFDGTINFPFYENSNTECGTANLKDGLRITTNQPNNPIHQIMMFGGSTVWGTGSSDRNTIPSILQRRVNLKSNLYSVKNYGFIAVTTQQQLNKLKTISVNKGDIVIFYDGGNDLWHGAVYGNPKGSIIGYNEANFFQITLNKVKYFFSTHSHLYQLMGWIKNSGNKPRSLDQCLKINDQELKERLKVSLESYESTIKEAKQYVANSGGTFYHFLQPTLFSREGNRSRYEEKLISLLPLDQACAIPILEEANKFYINNYLKIDPSGNDLSQELNSLQSGREYFLDWIHISSVGNDLIAKKIFTKIEQSITKQK